MARPRTNAPRAPRKPTISVQADTFTPEQLSYLAGNWDININMRGTSTIYPVAIQTRDEDGKAWCEYMAETYGGTVEAFNSGKGKPFYGWFVPVQRRFELMEILEYAGMIRSKGTNHRDALRGKFQKAVADLESITDDE
jgi:hypothetical protein